MTSADRQKKARVYLRSALKLVSYTEAKMMLADVFITDIKEIPEAKPKGIARAPAK